MKQTLLDAYLCRNLGDDMMVLELCEARSDVTFVAPDLPQGIGKSLAGVANLVSSSRGGWIAEAWNSDSFVLCGGSMFIDKKGRPLSDRLRFIKRWGRRLVVAFIVRARSGSVEVIGCNVGPIQTPWGHVLFGAFLRLASRVTVRDSPSEEIVLRHTGQAPVKAPDMVLSYLSRQPGRSSSANRNELVVGISVMTWPGLDGGETAEQYLTFINFLAEQFPGAQVKLFGFQSSIVRDDYLATLVAREAGHRINVSDCSYSGDVQAFLREFSSCSHILATRFHSGVLALGLGIPMVHLVYSEKISDFLGEIGWEGSHFTTGPHLMSRQSGEILASLLSSSASVFLPVEAGCHANSTSDQG